MAEIILYGGKGGVGKTTMAAATGVDLAGDGEETLVVSTDPAHSLGDVVDAHVGGEPTEISEQLYGVEVDPQAGVDRYESLFELLAADLADAGIRLDEEEISSLFTSGVMPGSDELAAVEGLATYLEADRWDRIVFDTAPTGHTLRLLDLPAVMDRGAAAALDLRDQVRRKVNTARTFVFGPMARRKREETDGFGEMRDRMARVSETLRDPERTSFRVVTVPERIVVEETRDLIERLRTFEIPVTTLVVNRVIADPGSCERCRARQATQEESLDRLRAAFPDLDLWIVPDRTDELVGVDALERISGHFRPAE